MVKNSKADTVTPVDLYLIIHPTLAARAENAVKNRSTITIITSEMEMRYIPSVRGSLIVMCHLQTSTLETALDVESFICLGTVKNTLYSNFVS
jgi:hypothetical protein